MHPAAIADCPDRFLRPILIALCRDQSEVALLASRYWTKLEDRERARRLGSVNAASRGAVVVQQRSSESNEEEEEEASGDASHSDDNEDGGDDDSVIEVAAHEVVTRNPVAGTKRKARCELIICGQCKEAYSEHDNGPEACTYHNGSLEIEWDDDFWADTEEEVHGPINTRENQEEFPEGFTWTCCKEQGDAEGCTMGPHKEIASRRR